MKLGLISLLLVALPACAAGSLDASGGPLPTGDDGSVSPQNDDASTVSDATVSDEEASGDDSAMPPTDDSSDTSPSDDSSPPIDTGLPDVPIADVVVPPLDAMVDGGSGSTACNTSDPLHAALYFAEYTQVLSKGGTNCFFFMCTAAQCCYPDSSNPLALCVAK